VWGRIFDPSLPNEARLLSGLAGATHELPWCCNLLPGCYSAAGFIAIIHHQLQTAVSISSAKTGR